MVSKMNNIGPEVIQFITIVNFGLENQKLLESSKIGEAKLKF